MPKGRSPPPPPSEKLFWLREVKLLGKGGGLAEESSSHRGRVAAEQLCFSLSGVPPLDPPPPSEKLFWLREVKLMGEGRW